MPSPQAMYLTSAVRSMYLPQHQPHCFDNAANQRLPAHDQVFTMELRNDLERDKVIRLLLRLVCRHTVDLSRVVGRGAGLQEREQ